MSTQTSIIKLKGKMDGISFYERDGVALARKAKGPSKKRIMTDPNYERTRENLSEFTGLTLAISTFLKSLLKVQYLRDKGLRGRLAKTLRLIMKYNLGIRGQRSIEISKQRKPLLGLELNGNQPLDSVFSAAPVTTHNPDRTSATITINSISREEVNNIPLGATHFKLVQFLAAVSDVAYDPYLKKYQEITTRLEKASAVTFSELYPVRTEINQPIELQAALALEGPLPENVSVIQCLGIIFFETIGTMTYPQKDGVAMQVIDVY